MYKKTRTEKEELKTKKNCKVNLLVKVPYKHLEYVRNENVMLRKAKKTEEYSYVTLATKNRELERHWK